jgi:hypothetical protein
MSSLLVSPLFAAGEILLGLSLTVFVVAFIATAGNKVRATTAASNRVRARTN